MDQLQKRMLISANNDTHGILRRINSHCLVFSIVIFAKCTFCCVTFFNGINNQLMISGRFYGKILIVQNIFTQYPNLTKRALFILLLFSFIIYLAEISVFYILIFWFYLLLFLSFKPFKLYNLYKGRLNRSEFNKVFWASWPVFYIIFIAILFIEMFFINYYFYLFFYTTTAIFYSLLFLSLLARRLHDTNRSGWWLLIGIVPPLFIIIILTSAFSKGDKNTNLYGQPTISRKFKLWSVLTGYWYEEEEKVFVGNEVPRL